LIPTSSRTCAPNANIGLRHQETLSVTLVLTAFKWAIQFTTARPVLVHTDKEATRCRLGVLTMPNDTSQSNILAWSMSQSREPIKVNRNTKLKQGKQQTTIQQYNNATIRTKYQGYSSGRCFDWMTCLVMQNDQSSTRNDEYHRCHRWARHGQSSFTVAICSSQSRPFDCWRKWSPLLVGFRRVHWICQPVCVHPSRLGFFPILFYYIIHSSNSVTPHGSPKVLTFALPTLKEP
jgi:hypothetical protein